MGGKPFWFPDKIVRDLAGGHEPSHAKAQVIARTTVVEQVKGNSVIRFAEYLKFVPGRSPDVARYHMTQRFEVADLEVTEVLWRGTVPVLVRGKIESGEAGKVMEPAVAAGVHGEGDIGVVNKE